jgi:hypothetical protein
LSSINIISVSSKFHNNLKIVGFHHYWNKIYTYFKLIWTYASTEIPRRNNHLSACYGFLFFEEKKNVSIIEKDENFSILLINDYIIWLILIILLITNVQFQLIVINWSINFCFVTHCLYIRLLSYWCIDGFAWLYHAYAWKVCGENFQIQKCYIQNVCTW